MVDSEATRKAFSGLIDKPALTDALLNRPPFKFILDIVTNTISATGYLKSQFPKSDLSPTALADKAAKTAFLDKLISSVDDGSLSQVKSAKIVAGKEPELTNLFLVKFAENARSHMSAGAPAKEKKSSSKERSSSKDKSKEKEKEKSKASSKDKERSSRSSSKDHKKDKKDDKKEPKEARSKSKDKGDKEEKKKKKHSSEDGEKKTKKHSKHKQEPEELEEMPSTSGITVPSVDMNSNLLDKEMDEGFEEVLRSESPILTEKLSPGNDSGVGELHNVLHAETEPPLAPPPAEREFQRPTTAAARPQTSMGRPGTAAARPAPPKLKKKHIAATEETPMVPEASVAILGEITEQQKEDHNDFVVEEAIQEEPFAQEMQENAPIEAEEGGLVQKMMETKAGLEEGQLLDDIDEDDSEFSREMNKIQELQKTLQTVTRTTYPLAHLFEFAQEDLESMMRELEKWRAETKTNEVELKDRESAGLGESHKLSNMLSSLDDEIRTVKSNLSNVKARILSNEERIQLLMNDV